VLSRGRTIYNGAGGLVPADHFASRGYPPQAGYNVADHLLDIASEPTDDILTDNRTLPVPFTGAGISRLSGSGSDDGTTKEKANVAPEDGTVAGPEPPPENIPAVTRRVFHRSNYASTFLTQFQVLCGREWKILRRSVSMRCAVPRTNFCCRDPTLFVAHMGIACILGVFCGGLYFKTGITIAGFQSRVGCLFFLVRLYAPLIVLLLISVVLGVFTFVLCPECFVQSC